MHRHVRLLLFVPLLALYGSAAVGGSALHALPGLGHDACLGSDDGDDERGAPSGYDATSHDDCPVCHFVSQSRMLAASDITVASDVVRNRPPVDAPPVPLLFPDASRSPRAPPLG